FKPRGVIEIDKGAIDEDQLMELVLDAGADDVNTEGELFEVLTPPAAFEAVKEALAQRKIVPASAELTRIAAQQVPVSEKDAERVLKLVDELEDHDDVLKVHANFTVPDEVMARLTR